jgi:hypothetical protein
MFKAEPGTTTDTWLTPRWVLKNLGKFDLDPCAAPAPRPWPTARRSYDITRGQDGLALSWNGRVYLNPPYSDADPWVQKMAAHKSGIACLAVKAEVRRWADFIWPSATAILLLIPRVKFCMPDGSESLGITHQTALVAWSRYDANVLRSCNLNGVLLENWKIVKGESEKCHK